jgi:hypothetical protein
MIYRLPFYRKCGIIEFQQGVFMSDRFDFEQMILECWHITADLELLEENIMDKDMTQDEMFNAVNGIKNVYEMRFNKLWDVFEEMIREGKLK